MKEILVQVQSPAEAVEAMVHRLGAVGVSTMPLHAAAGRITAEAIVTDRPSPPSDVSAMDGYAVRLADARPGRLPVAASVLPGQPTPDMPNGAAVRIMTGAVVPAGAEAVIMRERVTEADHCIELPADVVAQAGQNIRRRGENLAAGAEVVGPGVPLHAAVTTAAASFGYGTIQVHDRVRVASLITGDELLDASAEAADYQIRDSNGPALRAMLQPLPWVDFLPQHRVADQFEALLDAVRTALAECDMLLLTGGVSAGTHDFVPDALRKAGCELVFHRVPQRPGRPLLGAMGPAGQAVLGLPGNPQSVMTSMRRIGVGVLRQRGGFTECVERPARVRLSQPDERTLKLWWQRPVRLVGTGCAELLDSRGSGDVVAAARSDGFVELPPEGSGEGPWDYYSWSVAN